MRDTISSQYNQAQVTQLRFTIKHLKRLKHLKQSQVVLAQAEMRAAVNSRQMQKPDEKKEQGWCTVAQGQPHLSSGRGMTPKIKPIINTNKAQ